MIEQDRVKATISINLTKKHGLVVAIIAYLFLFTFTMGVIKAGYDRQCDAQEKATNSRIWDCHGPDVTMGPLVYGMFWPLYWPSHIFYLLAY